MRWLYFLSILCMGTCLANEQTPNRDEDLFRKDEQVFSGHVEFLYWTLEEGALDYALKMKAPAWGNNASDSNYAKGTFKTASYGFDPGFRVALSFYRAPRLWEITWQYTRNTLRGSDSSSAPEKSNQFLTGTWPQLIQGPLSEAKSHLHYNYNVFDFFVARMFFPNPHLRIRLIGGASAAWMSQQWIIHYINQDAEQSRINNKWSYAAGGLRFGTTLDWFWTQDIYITARGSLGLFLGSYHNHSKQTSQTAPTGGSGSYDTNLAAKDTTMENIRGASNCCMSLGPSWQKNFKQARIELFAGYELNLWTNLQELYRSSASSPQGAKETWMSTSTIALQGITIRASGDF